MNRLSLLLPLALAVSCRTADARYDRALTVLDPVSVGSALLYVDVGNHRAVRVDLSTAATTSDPVDIGHDAVLAVAREGTVMGAARTEALVLTRGRRGDPGVAPEAGALSVIPAAGSARRYTLGSPFNALSQTPDGRFAFAYFTTDRQATRLLFNPNEVAVVDLDAPPSATNPVLRTVRSFGGIPNGVVFSPPMRIQGETRTLAVVLSDAYVSIMDLAHLDRSEITVRLTLPEDPRAIRPEQALFDAQASTIYLRARSSDDLYVLQLNAVTPDGATGNDFRPTLNQLAAGRAPADMALFGAADARRLLVVSPGSSDARVIDARANTTVTIPLEAPADKILVFDATAPRDPMVATRALLYSTGSTVRAVSFLELADIEARRAQNVETVQIGRPVVSALALPERAVVMLGHPSSGAMGQLSLLDLAHRTVSPIFAEVALEGAQFDRDRAALWVAPHGSTRVGYIDLQSFRPGEVRLDAPVTQVVPVRDGGRSRVVAVHDAEGGWITLLDATTPRREDARSWQGFLLTGLLDEVTP